MTKLYTLINYTEAVKNPRDETASRQKKRSKLEIARNVKSKN